MLNFEDVEERDGTSSILLEADTKNLSFVQASVFHGTSGPRRASRPLGLSSQSLRSTPP